MKLAVVGSGYVGLVAGACFAESGNEVFCVDVDKDKIEGLKRGVIPIYEPGLEDLVVRNHESGTLNFTTDLKEAVEQSEIIFIAVGTPQDEDGSADLTHVLAVAEGIGRYMNGKKIIVDKSTVPVGTAAKVKAKISSLTKHPFEVVSNPEFLKEGSALDDFQKPDRVVVGVETEEAGEAMKQLYAPFVRTNNPVLVMDVASAEMTKYAANAMLATRISFMNEVANLCEKVGADIDLVRIGMGTDSRIGMGFLFPGIGYGGSCFPKDVQALIRTGKEYDSDLRVAMSVEEVNKAQKRVLPQKVKSEYGSNLKGKKFAIWGLAFKPKTDDVREAPALVVCQELLDAGATLALYDPEARETFKAKFPEQSGVEYHDKMYAALEGADALVICTEWNQFRQPNFKKIAESLKSKVIFDGRNLFEPDSMREMGYTYYCIGRPIVRG